MAIAVNSGPQASNLTLAGPAAVSGPTHQVATQPTSTLGAPTTSVATFAPGAAPAGSTSTSQPAATSTTDAAAAAAAAKQAQITSAINYGTSNAIAAGQAGTTGAGATIGEQGDQDLTAIQQGQNAIDLARTQAGATQISSIRQLQNTIKNGLQGTGVQLGNSGALSSSAADAAARAYAQYGDVQTNAANNTAASSNIAQDTQQTNLNDLTANDTDALNKARDDAVATIQGNAIAALNNLGTLVSVYLGGDASQINAPAIQAQIVQQAQDDLNQVDTNYTGLLQGVHPLQTGDVATAAETMANAGTNPASSSPYSATPLTGASSALSGGAPATGGASAPSLIPLTLNSPKTDPNSLIPGS